MNKSIEEYINKVFCCDVIELLKEMPSESVDLVFADPPYWLRLPKRKLIRWSGTEVKGVRDEWDMFKSLEDYDKFTESWLRGVQRVMKPTATIWVISSYHSLFRIGYIMHNLGYWFLNTVCWWRTNPVPHMLGRRFTESTEYMIWAVRDKKCKKYTFNRQYAKKWGIEDNISRACPNIWRIPVCSGKERLRDETGKRVHSTQKPEKLLERVILVSSSPGDIVLDLFSGTGTTSYVAKKHNRRFIAVEKNEKYIPYIKKRLALST